MDPKDFGLDPADRDNHEVISLYKKNTGDYERKLRADTAALLRKRRHDDKVTLSLALLDGLPSELDPILRDRFNAASNIIIPELVTASRKLKLSNYEGIGDAHDRLKLHSLAYAATVFAQQAAVPIAKVYRYRNIARELTNINTPDHGLRDIFLREFTDRRAMNSHSAGLPPMEEVTLPRNSKTVKGAYRLVADFAADGLIEPDRLSHALSTADILTTTMGKSASTPVAMALIDLALDTNRHYAQTQDIERALGHDVANKLNKVSSRYIVSPEKFEAAGDELKHVVLAGFIAETALKMDEIGRYEAKGLYKPGAAVIRVRIETLLRAEDRARKVILPHIGKVAHKGMREMFGETLDRVNAFNIAHPLPAPPPPAPPQLPPRP